MKKLSITSIKRDIREDVADTIRYAKRKLSDAMGNMAAISMDLATVKGIVGKRDASYCYVTDGKLFVSIRLTVESIKHDPVLNGMLERAVAMDLPITSSDYLTDWCSERAFKAKLPCGGELEIEARIDGDSATCRKIKTGTKTRTVEEDTYELLCD